jgi:hypothetical protein
MSDELFSIRSDYYRACAVFASTEEARYYLQGVYVEPHPVEGVIMVATDGHRLLAAHDPDGHCAAPAIVKVRGDALKAGKGKRTDGPYGRRFIAKSEDEITVLSLADGERNYECAWRIDGSFPDWRRVIPSKSNDKSQPMFNPNYLADFAKVSAELLVEKPTIFIQPNGEKAAALITLTHAHVFGLLMPVAADHVAGLPYFMSPDYKSEAAA